MKSWRKFFRLSMVDRWLLIKSTLLLGIITLGLKVLPFRTLRRFLANQSRLSTKEHSANQPSAERLIWAVKVARRYVPEATCLPQALTVQLLFKRGGYPAELYIGVTKDEKGQLEAHAWVESHGRIIIGNIQDLARYTRLPTLERGRA